MTQLTYELRPVPPFRLDLTVWTLRRRPTNNIDRWEGSTYRRVLVFRDRPVDVAVTQFGALDQPRLHVEVTGSRLPADTRFQVTAKLEKLLGIRIDLTAFYRFAEEDPQLGPLAARFVGMKPPRYASLFDTLVTAIACQQITLSQGIAMLNRLAATYGLAGREGQAQAFPLPQNLATVTLSAMRQLGFTEQKTRAILALAHALTTGQLVLERLSRLDNQMAAVSLQELRGVGRWTAEYVLLRGLGRLEVFPGDDVGARNILHRWLGLKEPLDYGSVNALLAKWHPYAGLLYLHLVLYGLAAQNPAWPDFDSGSTRL